MLGEGAQAPDLTSSVGLSIERTGADGVRLCRYCFLGMVATSVVYWGAA